MNYELCKKLKDAGFPQEYRKSNPIADFAYYDKSEELHLLHDDNDTGWWIGNEYGEVDRLDIERVLKEFTKCPTLSELIEACGKDKVFNLYNGNKRWEASKIGKEEDAFHGYGQTPEEAVANLWLALNKKV